MLAILTLGNFHVVSGAGARIFIPRVSFGLEDMFGSVSDCTSSPWVVATAQHGKLCRALQDAGMLESDFDRQARIREEFNSEVEERTRKMRQTLR